ncbi:MAG: thioredoxin family protein [Candidatus Aminicenantales bacterium]
MKNRGQGIVISALIAGLALLPGVLGSQDQPPAVGSPAPDFKLTCLDGNTHSLSDYRGKIVVLEWTNPGCPVVQRHYKDGLMPALQKECLDEGVVWLLINSTNPGHANFKPAEDLKRVYGEWKAAFTAFLMDPDGKAGKALGAKTTPHMFIIDKEGKLAYNGAVDDDPQGTRPDRMDYVKPAVEALLKGEPVATTTTKPYGCSVKYAE